MVEQVLEQNTRTRWKRNSWALLYTTSEKGVPHGLHSATSLTQPSSVFRRHPLGRRETKTFIMSNWPHDILVLTMAQTICQASIIRIGLNVYAEGSRDDCEHRTTFTAHHTKPFHSPVRYPLPAVPSSTSDDHCASCLLEMTF